MRRDNRYAAVLVLAAVFFLAFVVTGPGRYGSAPDAGEGARIVAEAPEDDRLRPARYAGTGSDSGGGFPGLPLDLNTATRDELMTIPGIGAKTAERIIDRRTESGGFTELSDLGAIEWLGGSRLARLRGLVYVKVHDEEDASDEPGSPGQAAGAR